MPRRIVISYPDEGAEAEVELLEKDAPRTCQFIWDHLPVSGDALHAIYSGPEVWMMMPPESKMEGPENATAIMIPGDVAYAFLKGGIELGFPGDITQIAWYYGRGGSPRHPDGPVPQNVFGRIVGDATKFYDVCRRMPREGTKRVEVRRVK